MFEGFIHWLEGHLMPCFYKKTFGIECPGCGMQRSLIELLHGNFVESFHLYPALLPTLIMFLFLFAHLVFKFRKGAQILQNMFIFTVAVIVISYIYKIINH
jgi:hypothetical protein